MKKIVLLAHDPGGYDAVSPVAAKLVLQGIPAEFYCIGPAQKLDSRFAVDEAEMEDKIRSMIDQSSMAGLITGTSWGSREEIYFIDLCKSQQIKTAAILDYWSNYAMRFQWEETYLYPDAYLVMDEIAREEAIADGVPEKILKVVGHPGLDKYVSCKKDHIPPLNDSRRILFLSQPLSLLYGDALGYTEQSVLKDVVRATGELGYQVQVKFHPKDKYDFQEQYRDIAIKGDLTEIMPQYDLIVGMSTMGLLHAALMGIPIMSYQPGLIKRDGCITNKLGMSKLIRSYCRMKANLQSQNQKAKWSFIAKDFIWADGKSTERIAKFVKEFFYQ